MICVPVVRVERADAVPGVPNGDVPISANDSLTYNSGGKKVHRAAFTEPMA